MAWSQVGVWSGLALVLAMAPPPALADQTATVTGMVAAGSGGATPFGADASTLAGDPFTISWSIASAGVGGAPFVQTFGATGSSLQGGSSNSTSPILATLTIAGKSFDDRGLWTNGALTLSDAASGRSMISLQAQDQDFGPGTATLAISISSATDPFLTDPSYLDGFSHAVMAGDQTAGLFSEDFGGLGGDFSLTLAPQTIDLGPVAAVTPAPEPSGWSLAILGAAAVGARLRTRRGRTLSA